MKNAKLVPVVLFAYFCCGLDCILDMLFRPEKREYFFIDNFGLTDESMKDAWLRVQLRPYSFRHEWVNLVTSWYEGPSQEKPAKLSGLVFLIATIAPAFLVWIF